MPRPPLPARLFARVAIGVLVPLLGVTWLVGASDVTLQVDGQPQQVVTHARTVGELLERAGVAYGPHDEIVPAPDTPVRDGMVVEVVHAREITLLVGGEEETLLVTALSVDDVIRELADRTDVTRRSLVRPSRLLPVRSGMTVSVVNPVPVTVVVDGKTRDVVTDAVDVAGVLDRVGIAVGGDDRVRPGLDTPVEKDLRITVEQVQRRRQTRQVAIPFPTEERHTDALPQGQRREIQAGREGVAKVVERIIVVDGDEASRKQIDRRVVTPPRPRIVEVGTAPPEPAQEADDRRPAPSKPSSQPKPAPRDEPADEPDPEPATNSDSGQASYYHHPEEGMTAAHRTLPFGTVVTVTNRANGKSVQVTINDRGPFIEGRIIDLNEPAFSRIAPTDSGVINVRISW